MMRDGGVTSFSVRQELPIDVWRSGKNYPSATDGAEIRAA